MPKPQPHAIAPPSLRATLWKGPAAIAVTPLVAAAGTVHGTGLEPTQPQARTRPFLSARLWKRPAAMAVTPLLASDGTKHCATFESPPQPQAMTRPSFRNARLWLAPAATVVMPLLAADGTVHCPSLVGSSWLPPLQ